MATLAALRKYQWPGIGLSRQPGIGIHGYRYGVGFVLSFAAFSTGFLFGRAV